MRASHSWRFAALLLLLFPLLAVVALPPAPAQAASELDYVGPISDAMAQRLRAIYDAGQAHGRRSNVFAKVGDSITASGSFLSDIAKQTEVLSSHTDLRPIIAFYRDVDVDRDGGVMHNSFNRSSIAAYPGWSGADILALDGDESPADSPLRREYAASNAAVSIIMFGTNDIDRYGLDRFKQALQMVVDQTVGSGIIPILSTIPDRMDSPAAYERTGPFNDAIRQLAAQRQLPLIDYWAALQSLPNHGLQRDMVHPSIYPTRNGAVVFTKAGLRYGWTLRNYLTLQMLKQVKEKVMW